MSSLYSETLDLLEVTRVPIQQVADDCHVSPRWLYRLMRHDYKDPGVNRIQRIHDYLLKVGQEAEQDSVSEEGEDDDDPSQEAA